MSCLDAAAEQFLIDLNLPPQNREAIEGKILLARTAFESSQSQLSPSTIVSDYATCTFSQADQVVNTTVSSITYYILFLCIITFVILFIIIMIVSFVTLHQGAFVVAAVLLYIILFILSSYMTATTLTKAVNVHENGIVACGTSAERALLIYGLQQDAAINNAICAYANA